MARGLARARRVFMYGATARPSPGTAATSTGSVETAGSPYSVSHDGGVDDLLRNWRKTLAALTSADPGHVDRVGHELLRRWSEPHRAYHNVAHLQAVLHNIDMLREDAPDPDTCMVAAWFHDAVHEGRPVTDEQASADLAVELLGELALEPDRIAETARLVNLTATHSPDAGDADGAVLCDADLAILASPPAEYDAYVAAVRAEYDHVAEADFRAGRAGVLRRLLAREPLFNTPTARELWEERARANLSAELDRE